MRSDDRNARIVKVTLEIKRLQAEKRRLLAEAAERVRQEVMGFARLGKPLARRKG